VTFFGLFLKHPIFRYYTPRIQEKADEMKAMSIQSAMDTVRSLETKLTEFADKHRSEIQNDPAFRHQFLQMCAPLGVDPLLSKKSFWNGVLGMGDFYYELVSIIICTACDRVNAVLFSCCAAVL